MEGKTAYTEDDLVQLYQDGVFTLQDFIENHPDGWFDEYIEFCDERGLEPEESSALAFLDWKNGELEEALADGRA